MKKLLLLVFTIAGIYASAQRNSSWYKLIQGSIGTYPITMHLHKMGHAYAGYYYYNKTQQLITINGNDTSRKGAIYLYAYTPGARDNEMFVFTITNNQINGKWWRNEKSQPLVFTANAIVPDTLTDFQLAFISGEQKLRPALKNSPQATFELATIWPENNGEGDRYIKKEIVRLLGGKSIPDTIDKLLYHHRQTFFSNYIEQYKSASDKDIAKMTPAFSADETNRIMIAYQSPEVITMAHYFYTYTGGAHGNHGTTYTVLDVKQRRPLTLDDIIEKEGRSALPKLLAKYFRKTYGLKPTDPLTAGSLFKDTIQPNNNFYITHKGIGFNYQPYEIGPYALGDVELFIPFSELPLKVYFN